MRRATKLFFYLLFFLVWPLVFSHFWSCTAGWVGGYSSRAMPSPPQTHIMIDIALFASYEETGPAFNKACRSETCNKRQLLSWTEQTGWMMKPFLDRTSGSSRFEYRKCGMMIVENSEGEKRARWTSVFDEMAELRWLNNHVFLFIDFYESWILNLESWWLSSSCSRRQVSLLLSELEDLRGVEQSSS